MLERIELKGLENSPRKIPKGKIHSPVHALADEISKEFGEPKKFAFYLGIIIRLGLWEARQKFSTLKQDNKLSNEERVKIFAACSRNKK